MREIKRRYIERRNKFNLAGTVSPTRIATMGSKGKQEWEHQQTDKAE